jgi:hypothetical protein
MTLRAEVETILETSAARDGGRPIADREKDLRVALSGERFAGRVQVVVDGADLLVLVKEERTSPRWSELRVDTRPAEAPDHHESPRRVADEALLQSVADMLEAKHRIDLATRHYGRGLPEDPSVFHDGVELAFRTWRDALSLSLRAQRALFKTAKHLTGTGPTRPAPVTRIEGPIRLRATATAGVYAGRMTIRNDRATTLSAKLVARVSGPARVSGDAVSAAFEPQVLRLRPGESSVVLIELRNGTVGTYRVEWFDPAPFAAMTLEAE